MFPASASTPIRSDLTLSVERQPLWTEADWQAAQFISRTVQFALELRRSDGCCWFALITEGDSAGETLAQWAIDGSTLRIFYSQLVSSYYVEFLLLDIILPKYLQLQGVALFHAAVAEIEGRAVLLTAPSGTGKSTLTLRLTQTGAHFMSDDLAVMRADGSNYTIAPAYPKTRLHQDSVTMLGTQARESIPKLIIEGPDWATFQTTPVPLGGIYVLERQGPDADICIHSLKGHSGLIRLIFDMQNDTPFPLPDAETQRRDAHFILDLMKHVPTRLLTYPSAYDQLGDVVDHLLLDFHQQCLRYA